MTEDISTRLAKFARTFPSMTGKAGIMDALPPWDAAAMDVWAASGGPSHGERVTAQFLLAIWNAEHPWQCGRFDLMEALRVWDSTHHRAFMAWAMNPWWA